MLNTLPYKNRTQGQSPDAANLAGAKIVESFATRGGEMHNCMPGCIVKCSNVVHDASGNYLTSALEFETLALLGSNCGVGNWEDVAELDRLCDEIGVDTVEAGAAIAVLMDAGQMEWGDVPKMKKMLEDIANATDLGTTVGNGAVSVGKRFNHARVPAVKGQAVPAWDPRPLKATGVTYATSPMGDSSGFCQFLQPTLTNMSEFYTHMFGEPVTPTQMAEIGWQCLEDEWEFNRRAGFTEADDDLPTCLREE